MQQQSVACVTGMGKSTVCQMFKKQGIPVWDADKVQPKYYTLLCLTSGFTFLLRQLQHVCNLQAVHELYAKDGLAVSAVGEAFSGCVVNGGEAVVHMNAGASLW